MQAFSLDQIVGQVIGNYRIERLLGAGRLNAVYLGRHLASQRLDAVTMYLVPAHLSAEARSRFLARFRKESAALIQLDHPHILPIYEYGEYVGTPYLVTPYVTQGSLADLLKRYGRYDHTDVVPMLEQLASGITYAHSKGYIHGTLRPSNVVVRDQEILQVAGFGLMHMLQLGGIEKSELPYAHLLTVGQTFLAPPEYIAPEVVQGQAIDIRSDIYALGCILFELLCGQPPFTGSDPLEVARQHTTQDMPSLRTLFPGVPIVLVSVLNQALSRDPARRFQYVEELKDAFIQASRGASPNSAQKGLPSAEKPNWSEQTQVSDRFRAISSNTSPLSNTGKWQLLPPIVTGKLPALPQSSTPGGVAGQRAYESQPAAITQPPNVSAQLPVATVAELPSYLADVGVDRAGPYPDLAPTREEQDESLLPIMNSLPGVYEDSRKLAETYSWWSQSESTPEEKPLPNTQKEKALFYTREEQGASTQSARIPSAREPLIVPSSDDWISEPVASGAFEPSPSTKKSKKGKKSGNTSRRSVVALLATGGVVAAGTAVVLNLNRLETLAGPHLEALTKLIHQSPITYTNTQANNPISQPTPHTQANTSQPTPTSQTQTKKGIVIGNTQQKANSAVDFTNPASDTPAILVRLPNNTFAAYNKACTHVGVLVNYDPATQMLVCPAHGAIFDPARGGAVVQGPATLPLPTIGIQVQADGTVTAI